MKISIMILSITTLGIKNPVIMTLSIMKISITILNITHRYHKDPLYNDSQHNENKYY
jgi:hypothetical protein